MYSVATTQKPGYVEARKDTANQPRGHFSASLHVIPALALVESCMIKVTISLPIDRKSLNTNGRAKSNSVLASEEI